MSKRKWEFWFRFTLFSIGSNTKQSYAANSPSVYLPLKASLLITSAEDVSHHAADS